MAVRLDREFRSRIPLSSSEITGNTFPQVSYRKFCLKLGGPSLENEIWSAMPNLDDDSDRVTGKSEVDFPIAADPSELTETIKV